MTCSSPIVPEPGDSSACTAHGTVVTSVFMETNTLHDKLDGLPWLTDPALRLEALIGFTVVAAPQGPLGPKHLGTLTSWEVHDEDRLVCVVDTADGPEVECYHYDVVAAAGIPLR